MKKGKVQEQPGEKRRRMMGHIPIGVVAYDWLKTVAATLIIVHSLGLLTGTLKGLVFLIQQSTIKYLFYY
jgi:hypothetical protein